MPRAPIPSQQDGRQDGDVHDTSQDQKRDDTPGDERREHPQRPGPVPRPRGAPGAETPPDEAL